MVLDELVVYLANLGIGTMGATPTLFYGKMPADPDVCTCLYEFGGLPHEPDLGRSAIRLEYPFIKAITRGVRNDYDGPRLVAQNIVTAFNNIVNQDVSGIRYLAVAPQQPPFPLLPDENERFRFVCHYHVMKEFSPGVAALLPTDPIAAGYYLLIDSFGGDSTGFQSTSISDGWPEGSSFTALVPGSNPILIDTTSLYPGSYYLEANAKVDPTGAANRVQVAMFNLDTDTIVPGSTIAFTAGEIYGERKRSGAITITTGSHQYGVKLTVNSITVGGAAWGCRLLRVT